MKICVNGPRKLLNLLHRSELGGDLGFDRLEGGGRGQLERDPGEVVAELGDREPAPAIGRIEDRRRIADHLLQHHEMVHVPVQDGRLLELLELVQLEPHRARRQLQIGGDGHQIVERRTAHRWRITLPEPGQVDAMPVMARDHNDRRQAAFRGLGLQDGRERARPGPMNAAAHCRTAPMMGPSSTCQRLRFSSTRLAPKVMPGRSRIEIGRFGRHARDLGDRAAAGAILLIGKGIEQQPHPLPHPGDPDRARRRIEPDFELAVLRDDRDQGLVGPRMLADLDADVADLAGDRRRQLEPVRPHQAGALLGKARPLAEQYGAVPARFDLALGALRDRIFERGALGDDPFGEGFDVRPSGQQRRARILDLALAAGAFTGEAGGAAQGRLGEIDLARGEAALPLQGGDGGGEVRPLFVEGGGFRGAGLHAKIDLPCQLGILVGQLLQLGADPVDALGERQRDQWLAGPNDVAVAHVELADFGRGGRIDAGDAGVVGDDAAHPGGGRIAAEDQDREQDRDDRCDQDRIEARGRRHRRDDIAFQPLALCLDNLFSEQRCVHGPRKGGIAEHRRYARDLNSRLIAAKPFGWPPRQVAWLSQS